jgi:hypothetical protein
MFVSQAVFKATMRPDGTMRKEKPIRKLADGRWYVPQEEIAKFETVASRNRSSTKSNLPVGMSPTVQPQAGGGGNNHKNKNKNKNSKEAAERYEFCVQMCVSVVPVISVIACTCDNLL